MKTIGILINPIAGMGGPLGLKGSDGEAVYKRLRQMANKQQAKNRLAIALEGLRNAEVHIMTCKGSMGEVVVKEINVKLLQVISVGGKRTSAQDTKQAVHTMLEAGVDLIVFAGGDGTARDIASVCGHAVPIIGIPAGVKMHSAVFGKSPREAGELLCDFIAGKVEKYQEVEIMDLDEDLYRQGIIAPRLFGTVRVPFDPKKLQCKKSRSLESEKSSQVDIAWEIIHQMDEGLYLVGPGSTTFEIFNQLGQEGTLIGVDAILNKKTYAKDLSEEGVLALLKQFKARCILTPVGGQGFLLGRGNQQLSPEVIKKIGKENIIVIATTNKLNSMQGQCIQVDTGDVALDQSLKGFVRIVTGIKEYRVYPIG